MSIDPDKENVDLEELSKRAINDREILQEILDSVLSKKDIIRFNAHEVLKLISNENPDVLYPHWMFFEELLESKNNYQKYIAIQMISNLTKVDRENRFDRIFEKFYKILGGEKTMVARQIVLCSGTIALNKPQLQPEITEKLLNIDKIHKGKQKDLLKGDAIENFDKYIHEADRQKEIIEFTREQLNSSSPKTNKRAEEYLIKWTACGLE